MNVIYFFRKASDIIEKKLWAMPMSLAARTGFWVAAADPLRCNGVSQPSPLTHHEYRIQGGLTKHHACFRIALEANPHNFPITLARGGEGGALPRIRDAGLDCTNAKGCVSEPLLHIEERFKIVVMWILYLVIRFGDYLTKFIRKKCKDLPPATRDRVQDRLNCAKTKISLKGHASQAGEETWLLLAHWRHIGKAMKLPNHIIDVVVQMASLLTALQSWAFNVSALNCKSIAKKFKQTICPTI